MRKSKVENLLKKYKKYWGDYRRYLQSNDEYIELLVKNNASKKRIQEEEQYNYSLIVRANTYYEMVEDLEKLLSEEV